MQTSQTSKHLDIHRIKPPLIRKIAMVLAFSAAVMTPSAANLLYSIVGAALLVVIPAASFLLWVSQKDALERGR